VIAGQPGGRRQGFGQRCWNGLQPKIVARSGLAEEGGDLVAIPPTIAWPRRAPLKITDQACLQLYPCLVGKTCYTTKMTSVVQTDAQGTPGLPRS